MGQDHSPTVEYLADEEINAEDDRRLRSLLSACFKGPDDNCFTHRRYFQEIPRHRWLIRAGNVAIIAHVAVHDKVLTSSEGDLRVGGVAEVCTHPDYRRRGFCKILLSTTHSWMVAQGTAFAVLFGPAVHYASSGYVSITNPIHYWDWKRREWVINSLKQAMVCPLADRAWPVGLIDLHGPIF
jgi:hypothetical protein